jgi:hypothetical protein
LTANFIYKKLTGPGLGATPGSSWWFSLIFSSLPGNFKKTELTTRVIRLGEFSPHGRLFTFGSFSKIAEAAQIYYVLM